MVADGIRFTIADLVDLLCVVQLSAKRNCVKRVV